MIYTVTLNPAMDKTLTVSGFEAGKVNRVKKVRTDPGGKGINVSKMLAVLNVESCAMGFLAGTTGDALEAEVKALGIRTDFIRVPGQTRTNTKITDPDSGLTTDINEPGPKLRGEHLDALRDKLEKTVRGGDTVVFSGSLPEGVPTDYYARLIPICRNRGVRTYLDTSGEALREGLKERPYMIKPNREELGELVGRKLFSVQDTVSAAREVALSSHSILCVTMGENGAIYCRNGITFYSEAPRILPECTVGAGDAALAGMIAAECDDMEPRDSLILAVACGAASAATPGSGSAPISAVLGYLDTLNCAAVMG